MKKLRLTAVILSLTLLSCSFVSCKEENTDFTLSLVSEGGAVITDTEIRVFDGLDKLVWAGETDSDGILSFSANANKEYKAVVEDLPLGYVAEESYKISSAETDIVVKTQLLPESEAKSTRFTLGSVFCDFTVTDADNNTHKLSQLLETKKAVILNFWFIGCTPCKMEFPYLADAYGDHSDTCEVIALNPIDGTQANVKEYAKENGLPFPCVAGGFDLATGLSLSAFPTTVVIDRYGTVAMMHTGAITEKEEFSRIFEYFSSDSYVQTTVRSINELNSKNN